MGYILHTYKLDSSKKPYLDRFYYVFKIGQKVDVIVPGYGEALHSVQVDEINEDGIYFHYLIGREGKGFFPIKDKKNLTAESEHWDYIKGTVHSISSYQVELFTVDDFFKKVLKDRYPDKEWITKNVMDNIPNPQDYLSYALNYWDQCSWWVYQIMYENYKFGKYGLPQGVEHYLEFIVRNLSLSDKKPFLDKYRSFMTIEFANIFEPYDKENNYCQEVNKVDYFHNDILSKRRLADVELRNDENALKEIMNLIHPRDNGTSLDDYYGSAIVVKYYVEGRFKNIISKDKALECAGIYLASKDKYSSYLFTSETESYYDYDDMDERDITTYYYKPGLALSYLKNKA